MSDELNVLAGAYVLDALDAEERALFEQHLQGCDECTEEVRGLREAAAELSRTTEVPAPPQLRAQVLAAISEVRPLAPIVDNVVALDRARAARSVWQVVAAACALVAIVAGGWGLAQHRDAQRAAARVPVVDSLFGATDLKANSTPFSHGSGTVVYSNSEQKAVLIGHGMPVLASDKTYQLWMLPPTGNPISAGTFKPNSAGEVQFPVSANLKDIPKMAISVEPSGGSKQPTAGTVQALNL